MQTSKIAYNLSGKIYQFSGYVSSGLDKTAKRFVGEAIYGMLCSQSVLLTEFGRTLQSTANFKKIKEHYCCQLQKPKLWDCIHRQVLNDAGARISPDTLLILDLSDITKKYAQKMQYLATMRDGRAEGELTNGYWTTHVINVDLDSDRVLPLYQELYSQEAPDLTSEKAQILAAIDRLEAVEEVRSIRVIDRGGDRNVLFDRLLDRQAPTEFIIRLVGEQHLLYRGKKKQALELTRTC